MYFADEAALAQFAESFAFALQKGDCVTLIGDLGAGKTTFARAIIRALASDFDKKLDVPSPTFTLVQPYETPLPVTHMDLYRLSDPEELDELGLDYALENGCALIEWPSKAEGLLPADRIEVSLIEPKGAPDARELAIKAPTSFTQRLNRSIQIRQFLNDNGHTNSNRAPFSGDASVRNYELIFEDEGQKPIILMDAPRVPLEPPIYDGLSYRQVVHLSDEVSAFVAISELLISKGLCAPHILGHDMPKGLLLVEHLGSDKVVDKNNVPISERYIVAAQTLAAIHGQKWPSAVDLPDGDVHSIPRYDTRAMQVGLSLLPQWWGKENDLSADEADRLIALWTPHFERFQSGYDDIILRDYHSPNIIWRDDEKGTNRIGIIDHQDAMIGPGTYDLAALMQDARTEVPADLQHAILTAYCAARDQSSGFDEAQTRLDVATLAAFRGSRLLGLWVRLDLRDGKPRFRSYIAQTRTYLAQALAHEALTDLRAWYLRNGAIDG